MSVVKIISLGATLSLFLGRMTLAQESAAVFPENYTPVIHWGSMKIETFSSVSTINRAAGQDTTSTAAAVAAVTAQPSSGSASPPASPPKTVPPPLPNAAASPPPGSQPNPPPKGTATSGSSSTTKAAGSSGSSSTPYSASYSFNPATLPPFPTLSLESPPDVLLLVPTIGVKRIELDVDNLVADVNLNAQVANFVTVNAGVHASIQKVNLTISDVGAELELVVRLGHLADVVNRVFQSLDINPLLINTINNITSVLDNAVGAVDGLLGSITRGGTVLNFLIDNLGHIVQQVVGENGKPVNTIVGDYSQNMTYTGQSQQLPNGLTQKSYKYGPLNSLVNIVFNAAGQVVSAQAVKGDKNQQQPQNPQKQPQQPVVPNPVDAAQPAAPQAPAPQAAMAPPNQPPQAQIPAAAP